MKRLHANVGSRNTALQQRPEILQPISVNATVNVLHGMVNNFVRVFRGESFIGFKGVRVESRASFDVLADFALQSMFLTIRNYRSANLPAALKNAHHGGLLFRAST